MLSPLMETLFTSGACLLWVRSGTFDPTRNLTSKAYQQLYDVLYEAGYKPITIGPSTSFVAKSDDNLVDFYKEHPYANNPQTQLALLNYLCDHANICFSIGMKSGGMDGLAFLRGLKTIYFGRSGKEDKRMERVRSAFKAFTFVPIIYEGEFDSFSEQELARIRCAISHS